MVAAVVYYMPKELRMLMRSHTAHIRFGIPDVRDNCRTDSTMCRSDSFKLGSTVSYVAALSIARINSETAHRVKY